MQGSLDPRLYRAWKHVNEPKKLMNYAMEVAKTRPVGHLRRPLEVAGWRGTRTLSDGLPCGIP